MKQLTCLPDLSGGHHRELTTRPLSALQLENPVLSYLSKRALNAERLRLRTAGRFATVVDQCKIVVGKGGDQSVELVKLGAGRDGRFVLEDWWQRGTERDCHYVFRATPLQSKGWRFHAVAYTVQDGVGAWSEDVSEVHAGYEVRVGQAASGTKKLSRKERRAAKALSAAAGSSSAVMFLDAAALPKRTNEVVNTLLSEPRVNTLLSEHRVNTLLSEDAAAELHQSFEQREKPLLHFVPQQVPPSGLTEEAYVSRGTISAWQLAVENDRQEQLAPEERLGFTLPNGKTYTAEEWQVEVDHYLEEERHCKFLEFSGLTEEAYVERKIQAEEWNLKKRKQAGDAAKQAGKWN
jgi:hypothetical protein